MLGLTHILLLTVVSKVLGSRRAPGGSTPKFGKVRNLITLGAPQVTFGELRKPDGTCFSGHRIVAMMSSSKVDYEDMVPKLMDLTPFKHPYMKTLIVTKDGHKLWDCGQNPWRVTVPDVSLHSVAKYSEFAVKLSNTSYWSEKDAIAMSSGISYSLSIDIAKLGAKAKGFNLVGSLTVDEDNCHLIQDPKTKRCLITFEGSDNAMDFVTDMSAVPAAFCGLSVYVHLGFRNELMRIVNSPMFQNEIRPKLSKCSSVDATGHSLGGAVAALFTLCNEYQNGSEEFNKMSWKLGGSSEIMDGV